MKSIFKAGVAAAAMMGAAMFASAPARADSMFSFTLGVPGLAFSVGSGGYCDDYGCPDEYWDYPVYYGPVYYGGAWFQGPVYYRQVDGEYWYWVRGGWHRDQWRGRHPSWWRSHEYRFGPALGYEYYRGHGFRHDRDPHWRGDSWRHGQRWDRHDNDRHDRDWDRNRHDNDHDGNRHDGDRDGHSNNWFQQHFNDRFHNNDHDGDRHDNDHSGDRHDNDRSGDHHRNDHDGDRHDNDDDND